MPPIRGADSPEMTGPSIRELVEFRDRYGLEAYLVWCVSFVEMPAWVLLNFMRIGRHFGSLPKERYDRTALQELIRVPMPPEALGELIRQSAAGQFVSLEMVREMAGAGHA